MSATAGKRGSPPPGPAGRRVGGLPTGGRSVNGFRVVAMMACAFLVLAVGLAGCSSAKGDVPSIKAGNITGFYVGAPSGRPSEESLPSAGPDVPLRDLAVAYNAVVLDPWSYRPLEEYKPLIVEMSLKDGRLIVVTFSRGYPGTHAHISEVVFESGAGSVREVKSTTTYDVDAPELFDVIRKLACQTLEERDLAIVDPVGSWLGWK